MHRRHVGPIAGLSAVVLVLGLFVSPVAAQNPPKLRYGYQKGQEYGYEVKITGELPDEEQTRDGVLTYSVVSAAEEQFVLKCTGNLAVHSKYKGSMPPFGPRGFGWGFRPRIRRVIGPNMPGGITLSRTGTVIVEGWENHLPFLLGEEEVLVIEPLSNEPQANWNKETELRVVERSGRHILMTDETKTGAKERLDYAVLEQKGDTVRISKKYTLQTAENAGIRYIDMTGTGELEFDLKRGVITSLSMTYKILVNEKNVTLTIPVTLSCRMLTDAQMAERKKKLEAEAAAKAEADRPKPFQPGECDKLLGDLQSGDKMRIKAAAQRLAKTIPDDKTVGVSAALAGAMKREADPWVAAELVKAAKVWPGPELEKPLIAATKSPQFFVRDAALESLGKLKTPAAAEAVAAQLARNWRVAGAALRAMGPVAEPVVLPYLSDNDFWVRAEAYKILGEIGGKKSLEAMTKRSANVDMGDRHGFDEALAAIKRRAPDDEGDAKPAETQPESTAQPGLRTWRDASGSFEVEARFVTYQNEKVTLQRKDGRKINVPLERLCEEDQVYVKKQPKPVNPFE
jgi:hypothetical protein